MKISIIKDKKLAIILKTLAIVFGIGLWLLIWHLFSEYIDLDFIFPGPQKTFSALLALLPTKDFWITVFASFLRIFEGFLLGVTVGTSLAIVCHGTVFLYEFFSIGMSVIKSTPVASIVMILWVIVGEGNLPMIIGLLMVAPIMWQNIIDGYNSIDGDLSEVCDVFEFSWAKRFRYLVFPTLVKFFVPAALTAIGLAWKSGIAAEIITYTKNSIGQNIFDAKNYFEGDKMFAWTLVVVFISLVLEKTIKFLIRRYLEHES